ncbi:MAG: chemotaxis protein CheW [Planctomycetes bacterium]|nr:chemotaxis protein CheW [Planctomycetota bacterium]
METSLAADDTTKIDTIKHLEGKYLSFIVNNEDYCLEVLKVREIIGIMKITPVPQSPNYVKGVINLRGKVIPVIDLRTKFGMTEAEHTKETCIIVVDVAHSLRGIIVDTVSEVLVVTHEQLEKSPKFGNNVENDIFLGLAKIKHRVKMILDIDKILDSADIHKLNDLPEVAA